MPSARARVLLAVLAALVVVLGVRNATGAAGWPAWTDALYYAIGIGAVVACGWRAWTARRERAAWSVMTLAMGVYASADIIWQLSFGDLPGDAIPYPSVPDGLYLAFFPLAYVALGLLVRARTAQVERAQWLDGVIVFLAAAALAGATGFDRLVSSTGGEPIAVAVNLAYPLGDLVLLAFVVALLAVFGRRGGGTWLVLAAGLLVFVVTDAVYLGQAAAGTYAENGLLDVGWALALVLFATAAWQRSVTVDARDVQDRGGMLISATAALSTVGVLVYDHYAPTSDLVTWLSAAALLALVVRFGMTYAANRRLLVALAAEARTDALTGLANRRALLDRLEIVAAADASATVALFDLDGFKAYNDRFGHLAGDALLERLAGRLGTAVSPGGEAFRIGGDEFCVILPADGAELRLHAAARALTERGEGFAIGASCGSAAVPAEAATPTAILALVDERMYQAKARGRGSAVAQTRDVLLRAVAERKPDLGHHVDDVAELAVAVARRLRLDEADVDRVRAAAELHDVGKLAIPDAILDKPGPLDDAERAFMRRHTIIGERILLAAPALAGVAPLVRSSHERWDGRGYPDGLAGEAIPLGARIVALCDAWDAMVSDRPYRAALGSDAALAELRRCAGAQFDPAVVAAFEGLVADGVAAPVAA